MNLDRFSQGLPDPQDAEVIGYCSYCGMEIYEGADNIDIHESCEAEEAADNEEDDNES